MNIRIGTQVDKRDIIGKYPHTKQVLGEDGYLVVAEENENIEAFAWAFVRKIPAPIDKSEMFVNVIETFAPKNQCKGIASNLVKKLIELAKAQSLYQIRAYCDINNISSHKLWEKNNFTISPVKNQNGEILGSYVSLLIGNKNECAKHYDILIDENNDPVHDPQPLKDYMDKWDGQLFINKMNLNSTKNVLEIGVGTGRLAIRVAPYVKSFTGIDVSYKTIERAKENLKLCNNVSFICDDFLSAEFNCKFDVIYSSLTFMHIQNKQTAIDKVASLLCENGLFLLSIDKNQEKNIDIGVNRIEIYPDNPQDILEYLKKANLMLIEQCETEFAHIFVAKR